MTLKEFGKKIVETIPGYLPEEYVGANIQTTEVIRNNDNELLALLIMRKDNPSSPSIYLNDYYEEYRHGAAICELAKEIARARIDNEPREYPGMESLADYVLSKDKIIPRLVNASANKKLLSKRPHYLMDDLAVVYCIFMGVYDGNFATVPITNELLEVYDVSQQELDAVAKKNLHQLMPGYFTPVRKFLIEKGFYPSDMPLPDKENQMYLLTTSLKTNGATAILDDSFMDRIISEIGEDFYVIPSSIHELYLAPKTMAISPEEITAIIRRTNSNRWLVPREDFLSNYLYEYDRKERCLRLAYGDNLSNTVNSIIKDYKRDSASGLLC